MNEILSLWRSALDQTALLQAEALCDCQPRCSITIDFDTNFTAMTIYNFGQYTGPPPISGPVNVALTTMFAAMSGANPIGGLVFVEQYGFTVWSNNFSVPDQCNIIGSGGGGSNPGAGSPFYHFAIDYTAGSSSIFLSCSGNYTSGGKYFRGLAFRGTNVASTSATCIYADTENCRIVNCTFTDIPTVFNAQGTACTLEQCTVDYTTKNGATAVIIGGTQCGIFGPGEVFQQPVNKNGPKNCTGVSIQGAEHAVLAGTHFSDWYVGIEFKNAAGTTNAEIRNCEVQSVQTALSIQLPSGSSEATSGVKATSCTFAKSNYSSTYDTMGEPVVIISPQSSTYSSLLSDISLVDCSVFNMDLCTIAGQHGLEIVGGTNIKIIGGTYSNNSSNGGAGIAITGPCGDVQIIGANLQPTYPWVGMAQINNQQYGLLISGGPVGTVFVSSCDLTGYTTSPQQAVLVSGTAPNELLIYDCPGYNDTGASLNGGVAPTSSVHAASCSTPYFGPSIIVFSNSSAVTLHIFGQAITLSFGIFFLPSPYDSFYFSVAPAAFTWIGK